MAAGLTGFFHIIHPSRATCRRYAPEYSPRRAPALAQLRAAVGEARLPPLRPRRAPVMAGQLGTTREATCARPLPSPAAHARSCAVYAAAALPGKRKDPPVFRRISAEKPGFEPGLRLSHTTPLAGEPLRPLGYFSKPKTKYSTGAKKGKRRERDSNPRCREASLVFKTSSINRSDISPDGLLNGPHHFRARFYIISDSPRPVKGFPSLFFGLFLRKAHGAKHDASNA